jgi:SAM-dependent methyltransferase
MSAGAYQGQELDVFALAGRWKAYVRSQLQPYLRGDVLEVGAGIGATTVWLLDERATSWTCLEPDGELAKRIPRGGATARCQVLVGTLAALPPIPRFNAILYLDVLEHIDGDAGELRRAEERLRPGGAIVVLAPAHQALYSQFDRAIGHHRRYSRASLRAIAPPGYREERIWYLDSAGMLASVFNRYLQRSGSPSRGQVLLWDRVLVPVSRVLDRLLGFRLGKSVLAVWIKAP